MSDSRIFTPMDTSTSTATSRSVSASTSTPTVRDTSPSELPATNDSPSPSASPSANTSKSNNNSILPTPQKCLADFCLIPIGTPSASVSAEIAHVQSFLKSTGVQYSMHSAGTTLEGPWDEVMHIIGQCHALMHARGVVRVQTDIRVGSRTDKQQSMQDKVDAVERLLREGEEL